MRLLPGLADAPRLVCAISLVHPIRSIRPGIFADPGRAAPRPRTRPKIVQRTPPRAQEVSHQGQKNSHERREGLWLALTGVRGVLNVQSI